MSEYLADRRCCGLTGVAWLFYIVVSVIHQPRLLTPLAPERGSACGIMVPCISTKSCYSVALHHSVEINKNNNLRNRGGSLLLSTTVTNAPCPGVSLEP